MSGSATRGQAWSKRALSLAIAAACAAAVVMVLHSLPSADATDPCGPSWMSSCYNNGGYAFTDGSPRCATVVAPAPCGQYRWIDQNDISPKPKPSYLWTEISTLVGPVPGTDPDTGNIDRQSYSTDCIPMTGSVFQPNMAFRFYNVDYDCVWVQSNGLIVFDKTTAFSGTNTPPVRPTDCPIPNASTGHPNTPPDFCSAPARFAQKPFPFAGVPGVVPNRPAVAGFWVKDMDPTQCFNPPAGNGGIFATAVGPVGARRFIIEWNGLLTYAQDSPTADCANTANCQMPPHTRCYWNTFQIVLYEASPVSGDASTIDVMYKVAQTPEDPESPTCTPPCPPAPAPVAPTCPPGTGANINCFAIGIYNPGPTTYGLTYAFDYAQAFAQHSVRFYINHDPTYGTTYLYEDPPVPQGITLAAPDVDGDQPRCEVQGIPPATTGVLDPAFAAPNNSCSRTFMPVQDFCTEWGALTPVTVPQRITDAVLSTGNAANSWAWMPPGVANIRVYCVNDAPFAGTGSPPDITGVQHTPLTYQDWAIDMFPGPFTAVDEDSQAITYVLQTTLPPSAFTVPPTLTRTPSPTSGMKATLTFTAREFGQFENVCWKAQDDGGLSPASPPAYDTSLGMVCVNIVVLPYQNGAGGTGVCGTLNPSFTVTGNQVDLGNALSFISKSTATGSDIVSWHWAFGDGFTAETEEATHAYTEAGDYTVRLTVVDDGGCASSAVTVIHVGPPTDGTPGDIYDPSRQPPFVDAGQDRVVLEGDHVVLHATASNLEPGDLVTYEWRQVAGPGVALQKPKTAMPDFTAPTLLDPNVPAVLEFSVRATTAKVTSAEDTVKITIATQNQRPPTADAGPDINRDYGEQVTLEGNRSADPDGNPLIYAWTHAGGAAPAAGLPASGVKPLITLAADAPEAYTEVLLTVSDGTYTSTDLVRIWMRPEAAPAVGFRALVQKDGVVTFTALGTSSSYTWDFGDGTSETTSTPSVTHTYATGGAYEVTLATDGSGAPPYKQPVYATVARGTLEPEDASTSWIGFALVFAVVAAFAVAAGLVYAWNRKGGRQ